MVRRVLGAAAIPAAPLLLSAASPAQPSEVADEVEALRRDVTQVLGSLPPADVVVLVAAGPGGIHNRGRASLAGLGLAGVETDLPIARELIREASRLTQYPLLRGDPLPLPHGVLALLVAQELGTRQILPLSVPEGADASVLLTLGAGLVEGVRAWGGTALVVAAGDLAATLTVGSPGYLVQGAEEWDRRVVDAFSAPNGQGILDLGPEEAERFGAHGWAPLAVLEGVRRRARLSADHVRYHAPRGVGQLVVRLVPDGEP